MSSKDRIFKVINKISVGLSSVEIELGSKYDFKAYMKDYDNSFTSSRSGVRDGLNKAKTSLDSHLSEITKILNKAESEIDDFGGKVKELGLDYTDTKNFKEFQELKKILLSRISSVKEKQKELSKIM